MSEENKKIKIVDGDGSTFYKNKKNTKKDIIVPSEKKIEKK